MHALASPPSCHFQIFVKPKGHVSVGTYGAALSAMIRLQHYYCLPRTNQIMALLSVDDGDCLIVLWLSWTQGR